MIIDLVDGEELKSIKVFVFVGLVGLWEPTDGEEPGEVAKWVQVGGPLVEDIHTGHEVVTGTQAIHQLT